jgi:hypothetical protein
MLSVLAAGAALPLLGWVAAPLGGERLRPSLASSLASHAPASHAAQDPDPDTAASCGKCHTEIHGEWLGRAHANAWVDEIYQAQLAEKTRQDNCLPCHIPQSALARIGKKPKTRDEHKDEGVTCVTCHKDNNTIHGPFGAQTKAHPTAKHAAFTLEGSAELCAGCHRTTIADVLGVARDHEEVYPAKVTKTCIECHMPEVERALAVDPESKQPSSPVRKGRSHVVLGPRDVDFCASAFGLSAKVQGDEVVLTVKNQAGHRVPGLKLRTFELHVALVDDGGKELATHVVELTGRDPLPIDPMARDFPFAKPAGAKAMTVRIDHLLMDEKVATVAEHQLPL